MRKRMTPIRMLVLVLCLLAAPAPQSASAQDFFPPEPLDASMRPALLYSTQDALDSPEQKLFLAFKRDGAWQRILLASGGYLSLQPLADAKLLASVGSGPGDSRLHLADLAAGTVQIASGRRGFDPLSFKGAHPRFVHWPENQTAFLIQDSETESSLEFITVNYGTMELSADMIQKSNFLSEWRADLPIAIAANGQHLAWAEPLGPGDIGENTHKFRLEVFHFSNRSTTPEDENVLVQVAPGADAGNVWPAFAWMDFNVVGYATAIRSNGVNQAEVAFRKVDVHEHKPSTLFAQVLPLAEEGGRLANSKQLRMLVYEPASGQRFAVDPVAMTLIPLPGEDSVALELESDRALVSAGPRLLFNAPGTAKLGTAIVSPGGQHYAYTLDVEGNGSVQTMVNLGDADAEAVGPPAAAATVYGWIE